MRVTYKLVVAFEGQRVENEWEIDPDDFENEEAIKEFLEEELRDFRNGLVDSWYERVGD